MSAAVQNLHEPLRIAVVPLVSFKKPGEEERLASRRVLRRTMSRIAAYRSYAAECLKRAEAAVEPADRHLFIEMAAGWHELAVMLTNYMEGHPGQEPPLDASHIMRRKAPGPQH